jgi:hypothetical protein
MSLFQDAADNTVIKCSDFSFALMQASVQLKVEIIFSRLEVMCLLA